VSLSVDLTNGSHNRRASFCNTSAGLGSGSEGRGSAAVVPSATPSRSKRSIPGARTCRFESADVIHCDFGSCSTCRMEIPSGA
jgi:hypothetical protein